jgi:two-component system chemotaxis response regulator CheB
MGDRAPSKRPLSKESHMAVAESHRDIVVIGGSAGAVEGLGKLVGDLPADLAAAVFVAIHMAPHSRSALPAILNRVGSLPAAAASDHEPIRPGRIYVATPDRHLLIDGERIRVTRGPRENGHRPAIDALFRSAAVSAGPRVIAVVLSGNLDDGTVGLAMVKRMGGVGLVQSDATYGEMPANAMRGAAVDHAVPLAEIADLVCRLVEESVDVGAFRRREERVRVVPDAPGQATEAAGESTDVVCPECGGALWEVGGDPVRYRCRVGHAYGIRSLLSANSSAVEQAMWSALRALEERAALLRRIASRFGQRENDRQAARFNEDADALLQHAEALRAVLLDPELGEEAADEGDTASDERS